MRAGREGGTDDTLSASRDTLSPYNIVLCVWLTLTFMAAIASAYAATATLFGVEAAIVTFGLGMAWTVAAPRTIRRLWRTLR